MTFIECKKVLKLTTDANSINCTKTQAKTINFYLIHLFCLVLFVRAMRTNALKRLWFGATVKYFVVFILCTILYTVGVGILLAQLSASYYKPMDLWFICKQILGHQWIQLVWLSSSSIVYKTWYDCHILRTTIFTTMRQTTTSIARRR